MPKKASKYILQIDTWDFEFNENEFRNYLLETTIVKIIRKDYFYDKQEGNLLEKVKLNFYLMCTNLMEYI